MRTGIVEDVQISTDIRLQVNEDAVWNKNLKCFIDFDNLKYNTNYSLWSQAWLGE